MICKKCGSELKPQAKFCPICGEKVEKIKHCSNCGNMMETGMKFCSSCGTSAVEAVEEELIVRKEDAAEETKKQVIPENVDADHPEDFVDSKQKEHTRTLEIFKSELKELSNEDNESKAVVSFFGTGVFYKHFYPLLQESERLLAIRQIQSKFLFARYRKEFVVLTDKRVIKFEKMQYFSPQMESLFYEEIKEVNSDEPSNAVSGTFIGEKICISSWDGHQINMRMVGKGEAKALEYRIMQEKKNHGISLPKGTASDVSKSRLNKGKRKFFIAGAIMIAVITVLIVLGIGSTGTELSEYIPLARADVIKFAEDNNLEEIMNDFMYENEDLIFTLNDNGNIDMLIIETPRYSLYGMKIGNEFTLEKNGRRLTEHNYGLLGEYGDRIVYGAVSDVDDSGGDRVIAITLDSAGVISKLEFMITDIQDILDAESEGAESEGIEIEDTESDITKSESVKSEYEPDTNNDSEEYFSAESSERYLTNEEISLMSDYEKLAVMYEIGARHGATFLNVEDGEEWQEYFNSKVWYIPSVPIELMEDDVLNAYEMSNIINISDSIMETLDTVNQGYMILPESNSRYYESYELSELTKEELRLARNEIYARHGRIFETEDLNQYFSSQPWYTGYLSADEFDDSVFNRYEKANLELIKSVEDEKASTGIATLAGSDVDWYLKYEEIETEVSSFYNNVSSQEEYTKKLMGEYQQWDKFLNEIYQYLKALYPDHRFEKIREDQRNWLKERDQAANQAIVDADGEYEDDAYYYVMISKTKERSQYLMDECLPVG